MPVNEPQLTEAVDRASAFLKKQVAAGNYGLSCAGSDGTPRFSNNKGHVFTGFFIAEALAGRITEIERTILLVRILSEELNGHWGFSPPGPRVGLEHEVFIVDADDTAYVLRTLRRFEINRPPQSLLAFHRPEENLFVTFNAPGPTRIVTEPSPANNLLAHPEVNANVFLALRGTNFERHINYGVARELQAPEGYWPAFYYPGRLFATHLFLDLIHGRSDLVDAEAKGIRFVQESQNADGTWGESSDPYETSLALNALAVCGRQRDEPFIRGVQNLLSTMNPDGSWRTARCIWEFHAKANDVWRAYDNHGTLTSALAVRALTRAL